MWFRSAPAVPILTTALGRPPADSYRARHAASAADARILPIPVTSTGSEWSKAVASARAATTNSGSPGAGLPNVSVPWEVEVISPG